MEFKCKKCEVCNKYEVSKPYKHSVDCLDYVDGEPMVHTDAHCHGISENFIRGYCKENGNISKTVSEVVEEITKIQLITNNLDEIKK